jgi:iron complex outermembrane recepter protein
MSLHHPSAVSAPWSSHPPATAARGRIWFAVAAMLACIGADPRASATALEEIVVTAVRQPVAQLSIPLSLGSVNRDAIVLVGSTHHAEILNRTPGAMIQRGSGQESLTAIRSPVLTGAGSCGAFLFLENSIPIRPVGFCNVNEMFEINTEQARAIEVLRGPGTAVYGSNAMHGMVNVLQAAPAERPALAAGLEAGPSAYGRIKLEASSAATDASYGIAGLYAHDGGWRDDSGYDEAKLNAVAAFRRGEMPARFDLAATLLDQDTAGFIVGKDAYRSDQLSRENLNPEAYREASAVRLTGLLEPSVAGTGKLELRPYLRTSRMEFLQHFLIGKPIERNGQESIGLLSSLAWHADPDWSVIAGLDLELADSFLEEDQPFPATGAPPAAIEIRPAGLHYDYEVRSYVAALYLHGERRFGQRWRATGGIRAESVSYDYDNRMLAGNTDENGMPCGGSGCLYTRPADRTDAFVNIAPKLSLAAELHPGVIAYAAASLGFRPPEITELYRLQRGQRVADLDSEQLNALELGIKSTSESLDLALALFDMRKSDVILREASGFNVGDGRTSHRGLEYELRWRPVQDLELSGLGTFARHRYEFSRAVEGGETIVSGNDIDTAPRDVHRAAIAWQPASPVVLEAEWLVVGEYWLDAANAHRYPGHELLNLRGRWQVAPGWSVAVRLNNALDRDYADRADYAFGNYRYFPGRGRALFAEIAWRHDP